MPRLPLLGDERAGAPEPTAVHEVEIEEEEEYGAETVEDDEDGMFSDSSASFASSPRSSLVVPHDVNVDSDVDESDIGHSSKMRHDAPRPIQIRLRPTPIASAYEPGPSPMDYFSQHRRRVERMSEDSDVDSERQTPFHTPTPAHPHTQQTPTPGYSGRPPMERRRTMSMGDFTPGVTGQPAVELSSAEPARLRSATGSRPTAASSRTATPAATPGGNVVNEPATFPANLKTPGPSSLPRPELTSSGSSSIPLAILQQQMLARQHDALQRQLASAAPPQDQTCNESWTTQEKMTAAELLAEGVPPSIILEDLRARAGVESNEVRLEREVTIKPRHGTVRRARRASLPTPPAPAFADAIVLSTGE